jgi:hypothetical protein
MDVFLTILMMFAFMIFIEDSKYEHYLVMGIIRGEHEPNSGND